MRGLAATVLLTLATASVAQAGFLVNPGAEAGNLTGWTVGGSSSPFADNGTFNPGINPHSGSYAFVGGTGLYGSLTQFVTLSSAGVTATQVDAGGVLAVVTFWEQGLNQGTPSDNGYVSLTFRDGVGGVIGNALTPTIDSHNGSWQNYTGSYTVPVGTRSVGYTMNFGRNVGSDLDAYFDDNDLTFSADQVSATPAPPGAVLAFSGLLLLAFRPVAERIRRNTIRRSVSATS